MDCILFLLICVSLPTLNAYTPKGYLGCYVDKFERILEKQLSNSESNCGDDCKLRCSSRGYRYAGTENAGECYCGFHVKNYPKSFDECNMICPGFRGEFCGGNLRISIYDTWKCARKPCRNNATCQDVSPTNYTCICNYGWGGKYCEEVQTTSKTPAVTSTSSKSFTDDLTTLHQEQRSKQSPIMVYVISAVGCVVVFIIAFVILLVICRKGRDKDKRKQQKNDDQSHIYNEVDELQGYRYVNEAYAGHQPNATETGQSTGERNEPSYNQYDYVKNQGYSMHLTPVYTKERNTLSPDLHSKSIPVNTNGDYEKLSNIHTTEHEYTSIDLHKNRDYESLHHINMSENEYRRLDMNTIKLTSTKPVTMD